MSNNFQRRQNTNGWWDVKIENIIDAGEELKGRELGTFKSTKDVEAYRDEINDWLRKAADLILQIYVDESIVNNYCHVVDEIDFQQSSRLHLINSLKSNIDQRIQEFRNLISSTS